MKVAVVEVVMLWGFVNGGEVNGDHLFIRNKSPNNLHTYIHTYIQGLDYIIITMHMILLYLCFT